jgi:hypothetical protein
LISISNCLLNIRRHSISTYASKGEGGVIDSYAYACSKMNTGGGGSLRLDFFCVRTNWTTPKCFSSVLKCIQIWFCAQMRNTLIRFHKWSHILWLNESLLKSLTLIKIIFLFIWSIFLTLNFDLKLLLTV